MHGPLRFAVIAACCAVPCLDAAGEAPWLMDAWWVDEGLPHNVINAIAQTPDGYLWVGTQGGLTRFDGTRFAPAQQRPFDTAAIRDLYADAEGRLWVLGQYGEVAFVRDGRIRSFGTNDGAPASGLQAPAEDAKGNIWFSGREGEGCFRLTGDRFTNAIPNCGPFWSMAFDTDGALYGASVNELWKAAPGQPAAVRAATVVQPSRRGGFWVAAGRECCFMRGGKWTKLADLPQEPVNAPQVTAHYEDSAGRFWITSWQHVPPVSVDTNGVVEEHDFNSRPNMLCRALFEDREGSRWWATSDDGLRRFRPRDLARVGDRPRVNTVIADGSNGVWMSSVDGVFHVIDNRMERVAAPENRVPGAWSLWAGRDGLWLGGNRSGLYEASPAGFHPMDDGAGSDLAYTALLRDAQGTLLLGTSRGLFHLDGKKIVPTQGAIGPSTIHAFAQDGRGRVYAATQDGLWIREEGRWSRAAGPLSGEDVTALWRGAEETLWAGAAGSGLWRLRPGRAFSFATTKVALPRGIFGIMDDRLGYLWLTSAGGIDRVSLAELNAVADGQTMDAEVRHFDRSDGMISSQCSSGEQPTVARTADGRMWFATARGLYVADPGKLSRNPLPPPVEIEEALVDDRPAWTHPLNGAQPSGAVLQARPGASRLEFRFTALSLTAPQRNRFRYQLQGLDRDWTDAGTRRVALYQKAPPGNYVFQVKAANSDGVWNDAGASLAVVVLPQWWQTLWFRLAASSAGALAVAGAYGWRVQTLKTERVAQQEFSRRLIDSQEAERQRIAAELHDSLGQTLLVIKSRALLALREPKIPAKVAAELEELTTMAGGAISEARAIAHNLRPCQLDELGLTRALRGMATNVGRASNLKIETEIDDLDGAFSTSEEINVFRITQELLNNVMKHAQASEAGVTVRRKDNSVYLTVRDNGRGFEAASRQARGFGLRGVAERVRILGGAWSVQSSPGAGAVVELIFPRADKEERA